MYNLFILLFSGRFWQPGTPESGRPARFAGRGRDYGELGHNVQSVYFPVFREILAARDSRVWTACQVCRERTGLRGIRSQCTICLFCCFQGDFGSQGLQGLDGLPGLPGEDGAPGFRGESIPGELGRAGPKGFEGLPGFPGIKGVKGMLSY